MTPTCRTVVIVQARLSSHRFPQKVLAPLADRPMLVHVLERAQKIPYVDAVVLAVPDEDYQTLGAIAEKQKVICYRGPKTDVLARYAMVARATQADLVVRVTGDCPLLAPDVAGLVVQAAQKVLNAGRPLYVSNVMPPSWPDGMDVEAFDAGLLWTASHTIMDAYQREHVLGAAIKAGVAAKWPINRRNISRPDKIDHSRLKLSVDSPGDLARVEWVMRHLEPERFDSVATIEAAGRAGLWPIRPRAVAQFAY
jgi:glutamate-1-semialdehyde 2,1-aminomutase